MKSRDIKSRPAWKLSVLHFLFAAAIALIAASCSLNGDRNGIKASGTIETIEVNVASKVGAQVETLLVDEGSVVAAGDALAIIDHSRLDFELRQAEGNAGVADAQLQLLLRGARSEDVQQAQEGLKQTEANFRVAEDDVKRVRDLFETRIVTQMEKDNAEARYTVALSQYNSAKQAVMKVKQLARPEEINAARARLAQATASVDLLKKTISDCRVTAPVGGVVTHKAVEAGELVGPGGTVVTVSKLDKVNLMIYVSEVELGKVKLGQPADVRIDSYPKRAFAGKVVYISPEAEFTPKNVQTKEDRVKLVFGVKISIDNPDGVLKPGTPADATLKTAGSTPR